MLFGKRRTLRPAASPDGAVFVSMGFPFGPFVVVLKTGETDAARPTPAAVADSTASLSRRERRTWAKLAERLQADG